MIESIVLAAGASSRMRQSKAALPLAAGGETFLSRLGRTLLDAGAPRITVVTGAFPDLLLEAWPDHDARVRVVHNAQWQLGQLSSILAGLAAVDAPGTEALLVALVDTPLVRVSTVRALMETWCATRAPVVRPSRAGQHGHPVVFGRAIFDELRAADLTRGAKPVVHAHRDALIDLKVDDDGAFRDADTPDDYAAMLRALAP